LKKQIIDYLLNKKGEKKFKNTISFGYTDLQIPLEILNIVYPNSKIEKLNKIIKPIEFFELSENNNIEEKDISPILKNSKEDSLDEIIDIISNNSSLYLK